MFNLLPEKEKKATRSEYSRRRLIVGLTFLLLAFAVAAVALVPSYVMTFYKQREINETAEALKKNIAIKNQAALNSVISNANRKAAVLSQVARSKPSDIIAAVISRKPPSVKVEAFSVGSQAVGKEKKVTVTVRGEAVDREMLLEFANGLKADPLFSQVEVPISNYARERDISFSITVIVK